MLTKAKAKAIKAQCTLRSSPKKMSTRSATMADTEDEAPGTSDEVKLESDNEASNHESNDRYLHGDHSMAAPSNSPVQTNKAAKSTTADTAQQLDWTVKKSKISREGKPPVPQAAPRVEHSLLKLVLDFDYRDQGSKALKERQQARVKEVKEVIHQGLKPLGQGNTGSNSSNGSFCSILSLINSMVHSIFSVV